MSAVGKVITGFSKPYVAKYAESSGVVSYTDCQKMARGVSVALSPEVGDANNFYADNIVAEASPGEFTGGTATLTVDGLFQEMESYLQGLPAADEDGWINYGRDQQVPFVGVGFVVRYLSGGTTYYTPVILTKTAAQPFSKNANTQAESVEYQTQEIVFNLYRDDTSDGRWQKVGGDLATEALAEAAITSFFGVTPPVPPVTSSQP